MSINPTIREDVAELFAVNPELDAEGFYSATEQNLFQDDDQVRPFIRSAPVDEDLLAEFVAAQLKIEGINSRLVEIDALITKIQDRLELAQSDYSKRLSKELYGKALTKLVELIGSKKQGKTGEKQHLREELKRIAAQRDAAIVSDKSAIWANWFQIEDPEKWMQDYLNADTIGHFDPEDIDSQADLTDRQREYDFLAEAHVAEMRAGEGLFYEDQKPVKENPVLPKRWYDESKAYAVRQEASRKAHDDGAFEALLKE